MLYRAYTWINSSDQKKPRRYKRIWKISSLHDSPTNMSKDIRKKNHRDFAEKSPVAQEQVKSRISILLVDAARSAHYRWSSYRMMKMSVGRRESSALAWVWGRATTGKYILSASFVFLASQPWRASERAEISDLSIITTAARALEKYREDCREFMAI